MTEGELPLEVVMITVPPWGWVFCHVHFDEEQARIHRLQARNSVFYPGNDDMVVIKKNEKEILRASSFVTGFLLGAFACGYYWSRRR